MRNLQNVVLAGASLLMLSACVTVKDEIFLRNIEVEGSPTQPAVHFTPAGKKKGDLTASPRLSVGSGTLSSSLERQFEGQTPDSLPDFRRKGLFWNMPRFDFGLDLDYTASGSLGIFGGLGLSVNRGRQLTSFYGGLGFFDADSGTNVRFDFGFHYSDFEFTGGTVILRTVGSGPQDTIYYLDRGKDFQFNLFASLTINSANPDQSLHWFLQIGVHPQTLTDFIPRDAASTPNTPYVVSDLRAESSVLWLSLTPGLAFDLSEGRRLLIGVRVLKDLQGETSSPGFLFLPTVQFNWSL